MDDTTRDQDDFERELSEELRRLHAGPPFPEEEIREGIGRRLASRSLPEGGRGARRFAGGRWWERGPARTLLPVAASLLLFIGGMEYGRRMLVRVPVTANPAGAVDRQAAAAGLGLPTGDDPSLPISIQAAGSRYVASLARLSGVEGDLSPEERQVALEVALAVFYGAAVQLLEESGDDDLLRQVAELVGRRRSQLRDAAMNAGLGL